MLSPESVNQYCPQLIGVSDKSKVNIGYEGVDEIVARGEC